MYIHVALYALVWIIFAWTIFSLVDSASGIDKIETMGVVHKDNPTTCIMEPEPILQERFYNEILTLTILTVQDWSDSMDLYTMNSKHYDPTGWDIPIKLVEYEDHFDKNVVDFPGCAIFLEFAKDNHGQHIKNQNALGYTQIDFSKSKHQWAFIMTYLESIEVGHKVAICIGCDTENEEIEIDLTPKPMPNSAIQKIIRHEYAHALGIGHYVEDRDTKNNVESLMYTQMNPFSQNTEETIPLHDRETLRQIYGNDGFGGIEGLPVRHYTTIEILDGAMKNMVDRFD